ncbi:50S ribosomal protein L25 [Verrucomicrobia bacterium]|nr:50S ribosomal protein L25 [Verrucomicrobiota bacterium]
MKAISLAANPRVLTKTIGSKKLRNAGTLPGIVYGNGEPQSVELVAKQFDKAAKSSIAKNFLVELEIDGKKSMALVQDTQKNPLTNHFIHVDFKRLTKDSVVIAQVPMRPVGTAEGVQLGGILQTPMHTITLKGKPADIPECIEPDISQLEVGQSILLEEIQLPKGVVAIGRRRAQVVSVTTSRMMAKAEEEDAAAKVADEATTAEGAKNEAGADAAAG